MAELEHIAVELAEVKAMVKRLLQEKPEPIEALIPLSEAAEALIVDKERTEASKQQAMYHRLRTEHYREGYEAFKIGGLWKFDLQACHRRDRFLRRKR